MKNILVTSLAIISLAACSSNNVPTPQKLSQDISQLPNTQVFSVVAKKNFRVPKNAQIIEEAGEFKTIDNIYDADGEKILIPRGAIVSGTYTNDGVNCKIVWKSIYVNDEEYDENRGSFILGEITEPSTCDPTRGIKSGGRVTIRVAK
jgi:hypothetical protein